MTSQLNDILAKEPRVWRASSGQNRHALVVDSGYAELNTLLHDGGWPLMASNEIYTPYDGFGELRLLLPALSRLTRSSFSQDGSCPQDNSGYIFWIAPPYVPFAPALTNEQIDISRLVIVQTSNVRDCLWAAEQAMLSGCCRAVFTWTGTTPLAMRELRRLQLAAQKHQCWHVLFRHVHCLQQSSPSALRMALKPDSKGKLHIHIIKQPGGWSGQQCSLSIDPHYETWQRLPVDLLPVYNEQNLPVIRHNPKPASNRYSASVTPLLDIPGTQG